VAAFTIPLVALLSAKKRASPWALMRFHLPFSVAEPDSNVPQAHSPSRASAQHSIGSRTKTYHHETATAPDQMGTKDAPGDFGARTSEEFGNLTLDNFESFALANSGACANDSTPQDLTLASCKSSILAPRPQSGSTTGQGL
jgi:hypothetical protein